MLPGIGVFGTGSVVKLIVPFLQKQGFKVEAIWGRTLPEASELAQALSIPFYTNQMDDVLLKKDVDLVFILCSANLHAQIAVKALGIGKHVLCDKPAGLSQSHALKMVRAAQYYPSLISILNHSLRFLPSFVRMREAIRSGYLGDVTLVDVSVKMASLLLDHNKYDEKCDSRMGGGTLTMVGSHVIDLIFYLTGRRAIRAHAVLRTFNKNTSNISGIRTITAPDFATFQMELGGGGLVTATLNTHLSGGFSQDIMVCGTRGHLIARGGDLHGFRGGTEGVEASEEILYTDDDDFSHPKESQLPTPYLKGLCKMMTALREAFLPVEDKKGWVKEPVASASTFEDGLYVQAVLEALNKSSLNREWVNVSVITEEPDPNPVLSAAVRRTGISI